MDDLSKNLKNLQSNPYPGRGIIMGLDESGHYLIQVYWIMGRSQNSRNRLFKFDGGRLYTDAIDLSKVVDPSLIMYDAMVEGANHAEKAYVVSNGHQTKAVAERGFLSLSEYKYEPDAPNYTPRITGIFYLQKDGSYQTLMSICRKSPYDNSCERPTFCYEKLPPGVGMCIHTYLGDGNPLPSFRGEPYPLPLRGHREDILNAYVGLLSIDNLISVAVKAIDRENGHSSILVANLS